MYSPAKYIDENAWRNLQCTKHDHGVIKASCGVDSIAEVHHYGIHKYMIIRKRQESLLLEKLYSP